MSAVPKPKSQDMAATRDLSREAWDATDMKPGDLASRYVDVADIPWKPTPYPGIDMKILLKDERSGLMTALFRWAPGSALGLHEHVEIEQSYVLEGSIEDEEGVCTAGNFVWRPKGNRHVARSPNGALLLAMFLRPNIFLSDGLEGRKLE